VINVFVDELTKIKESEDKAEEIRKEAKVDSKKKLEEAHAQAADILEKAEAEAKTIHDSLVKEGTEKSEAEYAAYLSKTEEDCKRMAEAAAAREEKAIALIKERIVRAGVDS